MSTSITVSLEELQQLILDAIGPDNGPTLSFKLRTDKNEKTGNITITNTSNLEVAPIAVIKKEEGQPAVLIQSDFGLSKNLSKTVRVINRNTACSVIIVYCNPLNDKKYIHAFNFSHLNESFDPLDENSELIKYSDYLNVYKQLSKLTYTEILNAFLK